MKIVLEIPDNKIRFAEEFFKSISFIKKIRFMESNEISNPTILKSIEDYEQGKVEPSPLNLDDLKKILSNA